MERRDIIYIYGPYFTVFELERSPYLDIFHAVVLAMNVEKAFHSNLKYLFSFRNIWFTKISLWF